MTQWLSGSFALPIDRSHTLRELDQRSHGTLARQFSLNTGDVRPDLCAVPPVGMVLRLVHAGLICCRPRCSVSGGILNARSVSLILSQLRFPFPSPCISPNFVPDSTPEQSSDSQTKTKARKATLLIVFVVVFIDLLGFGIVLPLLPRYGAHFNASRMQLGLLMASFSAMQFLFAPMWGSHCPIASDVVPCCWWACWAQRFAYVDVRRGDRALGRDRCFPAGHGSPDMAVHHTELAPASREPPSPRLRRSSLTARERKGAGKGMALIGAAFGIGFTFGPLIGAACTSVKSHRSR